MINDYGYFGDITSLDTTYGTNKNCMPLAVFVGFSNHRKMIVFGATLMFEETIPSFEWLFETFLKAMGGKKSQTIMTDQCAAMANVIVTVMPDTYHGLCSWYIRHNAPRHINHLYQKNANFTQKFEACINIYEEEQEFLSAWDNLLIYNNVPDDSWLHYIFEVKENGHGPMFVEHLQQIYMQSTQFSESINSDLKTYLKSGLNSVQIFTQFDRVVDEKQNNESITEYESCHKLPKLKMKRTPMLVQAGSIYTPKIFEEFQEDYEEFKEAYIKEHKEEYVYIVYIAANVDDSTERSVIGIHSEEMVSCDCRKFETHESLCSHALKVLDVMNIKFIPQQFILKR